MWFSIVWFVYNLSDHVTACASGPVDHVAVLPHWNNEEKKLANTTIAHCRKEQLVLVSALWVLLAFVILRSM